MTIAFVGDTSTEFLGYGTSFDLTETGCSEGDLLLLRAQTSGEAVDVVFSANGSGWVELYDDTPYASAMRVKLWGKFATADDAAGNSDPAFSSVGHDNGGTAWATAWSSSESWGGLSVAEVVAVVGTANEQELADGSTVDIVAPGITTPNDGDMVVAMYSGYNESSCNVTACTSPASNVGAANFGNGNGSQSCSTYCYGVKSSAGATGDLSFTHQAVSGGNSLFTSAHVVALTETYQIVATMADEDTLSIIPTVSFDDSGKWTRLEILRASYVGGDGVPALLVNDRYKGTYAWSYPTAIGNGDAAYIDLGLNSFRESVYVVLSNEDDQGYWGDGMGNLKLRKSVNSTNGTDGDWVDVIDASSVAHGPANYVGVNVPFAGYRWLRIEIHSDTEPSEIDEFEIWDSTGHVATDVVAFLGDSITTRYLKRGDQSGVGQQPSYQRVMSETYGRHYAAQVGCAYVGWGAAQLAAAIPDVLSTYSDLGYALITIGTNDANGGSAALATYRANVESILDQLIAGGVTPILAHIPYTANASYGGGDYENDDTYLYNQEIDAIVSSYGLTPGPDLYADAYENFALWYENSDGADTVHPGREGCRRINAAWAAVMNPIAQAAEAAGPVVPSSRPSLIARGVFGKDNFVRFPIRRPSRNTQWS